MEIRKGKNKDIIKIFSIIKNSIADMESEEIHQWDEIYPNEEIIRKDIQEKNLYVFVEDGIVKGTITLNESQDVEYKSINWTYNEGKNLVIHRLRVDSKYKRNGIATTFLKFAEEIGQQNGYQSIRLDSFTLNPHSNKLYEKNGYEKRGVVTFRKGEFYCFEKKI